MNKSDINLLITVFVMGNIYREVKVQNKFDIITDAHPFIFFFSFLLCNIILYNKWAIILSLLQTI